MITRVSEKDFTMYECIAVNAVGSTTATMEIRKHCFVFYAVSLLVSFMLFMYTSLALEVICSSDVQPKRNLSNP